MRRVLTTILAMLVLVATMGAGPVPKGDQDSRAVTPNKPYQIGQASWYGKQFHGRTTASGEPYDMFQLTAAHRQLPLGTWVKVTNVRNGRSVTVRINDRGPYVGNRIIDLSYGAAQMLGVRANGVAKVRLDLINGEEVAASLAGNQ